MARITPINLNYNISQLSNFKQFETDTNLEVKRNSLKSNSGAADAIYFTAKNEDDTSPKRFSTGTKIALGAATVVLGATIGIIAKGKKVIRNVNKIQEEISNLHGKIDDNVNFINMGFDSTKGKRPAHDTWGSVGQDWAMSRIEDGLRVLNENFDKLRTQREKLSKILKGKDRISNQKAHLQEEINRTQVNIQVANCSGYSPSNDSWAPLGSNDKFDTISSLESRLSQLKQELNQLS